MVGQDLQVAPEAPKRLQVLVLHGRQSNANLANFQISGLKTAFGKDVDFDFLEGALPWTYRPGVDLHDADPMSINLSKGKDFKVWFTHTTDDKRDRPDLYKQQDPGVCVTYDGVEAAVEMLLDRVSNGPRVDVVVAMFEGSIVVHLAAVKLMSQGQRVPWPVTVFFGSLPIRDDRLLAAFADGAKITHPTIHVFGKNDEYYFYGRRGAGRLAPEDYYEAPLILEHIEGHRLPSLQPQAGALYAQVVKEVKVCCGVPLDGGYDPSEFHSWRRSRRPAKPLAPPVLEMEQMIPRKLRILALTGGHSCTEVLRYQLAPLRQAVGRDLAEWTFIEGSEDWNWYEGEPIVSDMEQKLAKGAQLKNWYMDSIYEETPTKKPNREKQFDPKSRLGYHKIPEKVERLREQIYEDGPWDVLVAFSQGCIMTHLLAGHLRKEPPAKQASMRWHHTRNGTEQMPWRLSVFFCGMHIRDKEFMHLFETPLPHPTVHVFGKEDEFYDYGRDGFGYKPQEEYYIDPVILTHEEGHQFPTKQPRAKQIYDRVAAEIWRQCGGRPGRS
ncbi:unnamed protein product [Symbiodinium sp. CCMP2592]|nr:unnamed protein product [Symbiodinium sp. CCMP2592]